MRKSDVHDQYCVIQRYLSPACTGNGGLAACKAYFLKLPHPPTENFDKVAAHKAQGIQSNFRAANSTGVQVIEDHRTNITEISFRRR